MHNLPQTIKIPQTRNIQEEQEFRKKMRLVLDEWVATTIQLYFGKSTTESDEKFQAFIQVHQLYL